MLIEAIQTYLDGLNSKNNEAITKIVLTSPPSKDDVLEALTNIKQVLINRLTQLKVDGYADHKVEHLELVAFTITCAELYKLTQTNIQVLSLKNCNIVLGKELACMPREAKTLTLLDLKNTHGDGLSTSFLTYLLLNCPKLTTVNFAFTKIDPIILNHFYYRKVAVANLDIRGINLTDTECLLKILATMKKSANIDSRLNIDNQQAKKLSQHFLHDYNFENSKSYECNDEFLQHIVIEQYNLMLLIDSKAPKIHKKKNKLVLSTHEIEPLKLDNILNFQNEFSPTRNSTSAPARLINNDNSLLPFNKYSTKNSLKKNKSTPSIYTELLMDHEIKEHAELVSAPKPTSKKKQKFSLGKEILPTKTTEVSSKNNTPEKPNVSFEQDHQITLVSQEKLTSSTRQII